MSTYILILPEAIVVANRCGNSSWHEFLKVLINVSQPFSKSLLKLPEFCEWKLPPGHKIRHGFSKYKVDWLIFMEQ